MASKTNNFHFPEVRVVEASAGSGKTYALAKRYIQLLLNPSLKLEQIPLRNILAITFTNKAAFEMKARILEFLKKIALGKLSDAQQKDILAPLGIDSDQAKEKAFRIMEDLIRHYNFFQVQTIDEFINALLSGCAFKIGLTANFKIKTNAFDYLQFSLDELIDKTAKDKNVAVIFEYFLHNYLYLENRSGWFPKEDILNIVFALFREYNAYGLEFQTGAFAPQDLMKKKALILKEIQLLYQNLPPGTHSAFVKNLDKFLSKYTKGFDIDNISDYFAREEFPLKKGSELPPDVEQMWQLIRLNLKEFCLEESHSLFNPYIQIFNEVKGIFQSVSSREDVLFLEELNKKGEFLFDEGHITVQELYYRLATRFRHYLIDEFQDTSRLQWNNLEQMIEEALSTGGSLFYVGDQKQAIYQFRGGDVDLFDDVKKRFSAFSVQTEALTKNWRSQKVIVEFNNTIFSPDNLKAFILKKQEYEEEKGGTGILSDQELKEIENIFRFSQQTHDTRYEKGYVYVEHIDIDRKEERHACIRQKTLDLIRDLKTRLAYRDMAVLTRHNTEVEEVTNWLLEEGINVESERTSDVRENVLVQELIAFLKFLNSPIDNLSFVQFITGEIFLKKTGLSPDEIQGFVFGLRQRIEAEKNFYVYTEFRKVYPKLWEEVIEEFFKNVGLFPLYELVVSIYGRLECLANFPSHQGFLMHFLELIKRKENEFSDIAGFLNYFENMKGDEPYVHITDSNAVKVLTIHKAKGLEFPVVLLPFLAMDVQVGSRTADNKQSYVTRKQDETVTLLKLKEKYYKFSDELFDLYRQEYLETFISELNSVYVALTRAKEELYCFIPKKIANRVNDVRFLLPSGVTTLGEKNAFLETKTKDAHLFPVKASCYRDWIYFLKEEFVSLEEIAHRDLRRQGQYVHAVLAAIENVYQKDLGDIVDQAILKAGQQFSCPSSDIKEGIVKLLKDKNIRPFFEIATGEVFVEKEIVDSFGATHRLDRMIVKNDEVVIVDFKSSEPVDKKPYQDQLAVYLKLVRQMYPNKTVKGYLVYMDSLGVEEV
ncbi:MAG: UvrD-helicase domain-containing protein [Candidatus Omnitrophica bacterium]|nr:UvrD-helicase domain-containing protein [Candidatus Omnitrophota bacterium]